MSSKVDRKFKEDLSWEEKANCNPLFAVMSAERFADKGSRVCDWTKADLDVFFAKGQFIYETFLRPVLHRIDLSPEKAFLVEYGSGMGRILKAVNTDGFNCAGIDVSRTMLDYSRQLVPEVQNLSVLDSNGRCDIPSESADFVYSYAVLQHIHKLRALEQALDEMCRILKRGGALKFQFRTLGSPLKQVNLRERIWLFNLESESFTVQWRKISLKGFVPAWLPSLLVPRRIKHTNWVGVPLSANSVQRLLKKRRVRLLGIEEDIGHASMAWALARKED